MSRTQPERLLIMDACVLIDYMNGEPELDDVFLAGELDGKTSFQDNICYLTAKRQGLTCVTNDKNLRNRCEESEVPLIWGMELILKLVEAGGIAKEEALLIAEEIHKTNPRHIGKKVLRGFRNKLAAL